jgi:hypothetical protein
MRRRSSDSDSNPTPRPSLDLQDQVMRHAEACERRNRVEECIESLNDERSSVATLKENLEELLEIVEQPDTAFSTIRKVSRAVDKVPDHPNYDFSLLLCYRDIGAAVSKARLEYRTR